ncbi:class I SAM-dependent methyltransferase [Streptomyces sp. NBC_01497]|uniref:class I SAM-dependent methyltransferase n=1 Tax=Streptomyces sp. NBC_01497 TaxID=2903885 RepID=UPI002E342E96|nr:DNA methylase [Streptomyces sp. NBC_01497]
MTQPVLFQRARPLRVLDAFSCIGGAARGYQYAGCHVTGVDLRPMPDYAGDDFHQGDAIAYIHDHGHEFDFIHASPPCQGEGSPAKGTNARRGNPHPRLIEPTRTALEATGRPWVMENVPGSSVRKDIRLCGESFGLAVLMHRYFELGRWTTRQPAHPKHRGYVRGWRHGEYREGPYVAAYGAGGGKATVEEIRAAKGIGWSTDHFNLREALPPAYTEWIAHAYLAQSSAGRAAA